MKTPTELIRIYQDEYEACQANKIPATLAVEWLSQIDNHESTNKAS